jgi:CRP-like cAMP-binding protein
MRSSQELSRKPYRRRRLFLLVTLIIAQYLALLSTGQPSAFAFEAIMMRDHPNQLLARLPHATWEQVKPILSVVSVARGDPLAETHAEVSNVYFPHSGIISCVVELVGGGAIETGMIGHDGQFGGGLALDHRLSPNYVVMQIAGDVSVAKADAVRDLALVDASFRACIMAYEQFFIAQVQQTAACNAVHHVQARTCKWLLRMHSLVGSELFLTQEFLAQMMGVRRSSVSAVAAELQKAGMISYRRGYINILDLDRIKHWACECDEAVQSHYQVLVARPDRT